MVDYVLVPKKVMKNVKNVKVIPGEKCFWQHWLFIINLMLVDIFSIREFKNIKFQKSETVELKIGKRNSKSDERINKRNCKGIGMLGRLNLEHPEICQKSLQNIKRRPETKYNMVVKYTSKRDHQKEKISR